MACRIIRTADGIAAFVCGPRPRRRTCQEPGCDRPGTRQCDFPIGGGKTCDRYVCADHAERRGPELDYCPGHAEAPARRRQGELLFGALIVALLALVGGALAAPPDGADPASPLSAWYRSLTSPATGGSCCSEADCRPVEAKPTDRGWAIKQGDLWVDVPPGVVLRRENRDGRPIACVLNGVILCFEPPSGA